MSSVGSKRSNEMLNSDSGSSIKKRAKMDIDFDSKFIATSQDDIDIGLLRAQNRRLAERIQQRQRIESELRARIEYLEKKLLNDDTKLYAINRYWNQFNEDVHLILQRFESKTESNNQSNEDSNDGETAVESRNENETTSFLRQLANVDKDELDEELQKRVLLSNRALSKLLQAYNRIIQRNEKIMITLKERTCEDLDDENEKQKDDDNDDDTIKSPDSVDDEVDGESKNNAKPKKIKLLKIDDAIRQLNEELTRENKNLNHLITKMHEKQHTIAMKHNVLTDKIDSKDLQLDELKNRIDELEFQLNKSKTREQRLEDHLYEAKGRLQDLQNHSQNVDNSCAQKHEQTGGGGSTKIEDLKRELEEQKELASSRLAELEQLNNTHKETLKQVEQYKANLQCIPEAVIKKSSEYISLQSNFSVLFNETIKLQTQLDETRTQLTTTKNIHMRQIEQMEAEELTMQKRLRTECIQLEETLQQVRKEHEMLRLEFEQMLASNEQTVPINREMRHLIASLQSHHQQLIGENTRIKKKLKEANNEIARLKSIILQNDLKVCCGDGSFPKSADNNGNSICTVDCCRNAMNNKSMADKPELFCDLSNDGMNVKNEESSIINHKDEDKIEMESELINELKAASSIGKSHQSSDNLESSNMDYDSSSSRVTQTLSSSHRSKSDEIRELKMQLKKSHETQRELKLLLDMFKSIDKEKKDKALLVASEKKIRIELEEVRQQNKKLLEEKRNNLDSRRSKMPEDENKKITKYEELIKDLQKNVAIHRQQEEALLNEMEVTGQAFEDMQEQNCRLIQQLREKDDANFKLMSERIKSNQVQKFLNEEKEMLTEQIVSLQRQIETQNQVVRKLEEKERALQNNITINEKELTCRQQTMEFYKRKAVESSQTVQDLKLHMEKYQAQIKEAQSIVADKTSAWQQEAFKTKRLHEEVISYKRKYERAKKFELATTVDEVLQEEVRELREELTCPSCKTKRKDAVLNKCFHVFCYDCLKTRYETRQRKCPKCNQSFSANDFHRLYLA